MKQALFAQIEPLRAAHAIVSSNTSGIPISALADGRSEDFRRHLLGTHFFNPPRYLRLVEIIPTRETDPAVVERLSSFVDHRLGKGVVVTKDTPNFIANHIGLYGVVQLMRALESGELHGRGDRRHHRAGNRPTEERHVPDHGHRRARRGRTRRCATSPSACRTRPRAHGFTLPHIVEQLIAKGWTGEKSGQGFYKREGSEILTLDPSTLTYRPKQSAADPVARRREGRRLGGRARPHAVHRE